MTMKDFAFQLEDLELKMRILSDILSAVNDAIFEGSSNGENYKYAIYMANSTSIDLQKELREMMESAFEAIKKDNIRKSGEKYEKVV
mgnify:CR=1 FL=1